MKSNSPESSTEDAQLARAAVEDSEAFAELYRRNVARIYRYFLAHTGNTHDAEDLTSQTFMAALESIRSYRGAGSFAAWIMGIAVKKRAGFFRSRRFEEPLNEAEQVSTAELTPDGAVHQKFLTDQILRALRQISPDRAEALILCFFGGLNIREASRVLGKSETALRMSISRGLNDLRTRTPLALETKNER
ncbi:MAG TPA: RNA polymerase sigma factor [Anaerolineaceae bacterium]|nr:RNA polymerase sigma factor [Anaerolineaceae bacterium]